MDCPKISLIDYFHEHIQPWIVHYIIIQLFYQYQQKARVTRRLSLVDQELLTVPEHLSSPPAFSGVRVTRSLVLSQSFLYKFVRM
jgi:hypothetical protein